MKKIILTGRETNEQLRVLLDNVNVKYSRLDNKTKLIEHVNDYNSSIDVVKKVVPSQQNAIFTENPKSIVKEISLKVKEEIIEPKIDADQYCNMIITNDRTRFFLNKKYKGQIHSISEWESIFRSERLI